VKELGGFRLILRKPVNLKGVKSRKKWAYMTRIVLMDILQTWNKFDMILFVFGGFVLVVCQP